MPISMIVHGGAWAIPDDEVAAHLQGVQVALELGWRLLEAGATALEACTAAVQQMEDDPTFDAGTGSFLNADGQVEMDAAIMDGRTLDVGAVAAVGRVRNPIQLARYVMQTEHVLIVGAGAEQLAARVGIRTCEPRELIVPREVERWQRTQADPHFATADAFRARDTVGALALDQHGHLAAAISTGGTPNKLPGRVGDSPLVGCGFYADNSAGACFATGEGEAIMRVVLAKSVVDRLAQGLTAQQAAQAEIERLGQRTRGAAGCIVLHADGSPGAFHTTPRMAHAYRRWGKPPVVRIKV